MAFRTQLKAIHAWGRQEPADLTGIQQPVLVVNGEHDRMVPSSNSVDLARRLPNAELRLIGSFGGAYTGDPAKEGGVVRLPR